MDAEHQILPPEVTDIIIDHLHSEVRALKACSLVCKAWLPSCQYHLFHSIHLKFRSTTMPDPQSFRNARPCVRRLRLTHCNIDFPGFAALARQLPALEILWLSDVGWRRFEIDQAVQDGQMLPRLRVLRLEHWSVARDLTALIARGVIKGHIQRVQFGVEPSCANALGALLRTIGLSLRELVIAAETMLQEIQGAFALGENTSLVAVHFTNLVDPYHGSESTGKCSFNWVIALLHQLPPSVERVMFSIWLIPGDRLGLDEEQGDSIDWAKLVQALMRLVGLRSVELRLNAKKLHRDWLRRKCEQRHPELKCLLQVIDLCDDREFDF